MAAFENTLPMLPIPVNSQLWPALPLGAWQETYDTLHMWTQVVGKVALATTPLSNHYWNIAFRLTSRGFETQPLVSNGHTFTATFDMVGHELAFTCTDGRRAAIALRPQMVADFYAAVMKTLDEMGVDIRIWPMPVEFPDPIRFDEDTTHHSYDPAWANAFWRAMASMRPVLEEFRCGFVGKCSPVHFFWGSFDLAVTRFSGRRAPDKLEADPVTRESYSHEVIGHGFWPGGGAVKEAAFYAYAAPEPAGLKLARVESAAAFYSTDSAVRARDLRSARRCLADDLLFVGLFQTYRRAEEYLAALTMLLGITLRLDVKVVVAEGENAAVFFELETKAPAAATTLVAEWHQVREGKIRRVESAFDGRPFAAMFSPA